MRLGAGMEFSQYRPYSQGDDLRRLDWKMYGKTERYYVKQSEIESDIHLNLVIDHSRSMTYAEEAISKLDSAKLIAALLAYIALRNGDGFSLICGDQILPVGHGDKQWQRLLHRLTELQPVDRFQPEMLSGNFTGVTVVLSDFFGEDQDWIQLLKSFNRPDSEVFAFQILGEAEQSLDFSGAIAFEDLETGQKVKVDARKQVQAYRERLSTWTNQFKKDLTQAGIKYEPLTMNEHPGRFVQTFLKRTQNTFG